MHTNLKTKIIRILVIFISISVAAFVVLPFYKAYKIKQKYISMGIYEVLETFSFIQVYNSLMAVYMVCEPASDYEKNKTDISKYIHEQNIVQNLKNRMPENFQGNEIILYFVKPSKDFPIGWNKGTKSNFFSGEITKHSIVTVYIPWDAKSEEEYYYFP